MWAVVPLKSPERAKTRLAAALSAAQRRHLLFTLAERAIDALLATSGVEAVAVVTANSDVAAFARARGALAIIESSEFGTAAAFAAAVRQLDSSQLSRLLMLAGDLPLVSTQALSRLIAASADAPSVVIVPDRHRIGTNAMLCTPPSVLTPCFGDNSFQRHLHAARAAGVNAAVFELEELALDLDSIDDLDFLRLHGGARAATLLRGLHEVEFDAGRLELGVAVNG